VVPVEWKAHAARNPQYVSFVLFYRKPFRFTANFLKPRNEGVIRFNRSLYRRIIRRSKPNGLQQFAANVLH
jgi:hypothetical protein